MAQTTKQHADQVQATVARGSAAKSAVVASWRRSSNFHRLDPAECNLPRRLSQSEFESARQRRNRRTLMPDFTTDSFWQCYPLV